MSGDLASQRRRKPYRRPLPARAAEAEGFLDALLACFDELPGTDAAIAAAQKAMFYAWQAVAPSIGNIGKLSPLGRDAGSVLARRAEMATALNFLRGAGIAPDVAARLLVGIEELARGVTIPELEAPAGKLRGGRTPTAALSLMRVAVEAADAVAAVNGKREAIDAALSACGTSRRTVEGWRKRLEAGPMEYRPRKFSILAWGATPPDDVLAAAVAAIKAS